MSKILTDPRVENREHPTDRMGRGISRQKHRMSRNAEATFQCTFESESDIEPVAARKQELHMTVGVGGTDVPRKRQTDGESGNRIPDAIKS